MLVIIQILAILLKLAGYLNISWVWVFMPVYLWIMTFVASFIFYVILDMLRTKPRK